MKITKVLLVGMISLAVVFALLSMTSAVENSTACCQKTKTGLYCQDFPEAQCETSAINSVTNKPFVAVPTSCASTSYCKPGYCYDSVEGTCSDRTPQFICNMNNGTWSEKKPAQCNLGCCVLGDQAAFVPLVRCKRLSSFLGLETNFKKDVTDEVQCVLSVQSQEKGACVYESDFEPTCKFTTRSDCEGSFGIDKAINTTASLKGKFYKGKLCTAEELGTQCAPTTRTICVPGKDEVYFVDSCGNPANIYDASKVNDKEYWGNIKDKTQICGANQANGNSQACGNCNYLLGSVCRNAKTASAPTPTYGENICADLNCKKTQNGKSYKHGESWCVWNDYGTTGQGKDSVGSRFFKHICINGEEVLEQCADFRQEECIQDTISAGGTTFSQAACRVNRWQDCTTQREAADCTNTDKRDCYWKNGTLLSSVNESDTGENGVCLPKNPPGLQFWSGDDAKTICAQANAVCVVKFEKGIFGSKEAVENEECLTDAWVKQKSEICMSLGDCGPNVNWLGTAGYKKGYKVTTKEGGGPSSDSSSSGGLFG